jgi:hypothetical protein
MLQNPPKTSIAFFTLIFLCACAGSRPQRQQDDFELLSTESITAPVCTPARGITTIVMDQQLIPEHLERRAAVKDIRIVIDWMTRIKEQRLMLKMVSYTYLKVKGGKSAMPVKLHDTVSEISPEGQILALKINPDSNGESSGADDPVKIERSKKIASSFAGMFIPAFQTQALNAGQTVASSVERFDRLVNDDRPVRTNYIYRGLSRFKDRVVIVVDYDEVTDIGPFTIIQKGYHLYDADRRYLVTSRGSTQILQDGKPYYSVSLQADTVFSR